MLKSMRYTSDTNQNEYWYKVTRDVRLSTANDLYNGYWNTMFKIWHGYTYESFVYGIVNKC